MIKGLQHSWPFSLLWQFYVRRSQKSLKRRTRMHFIKTLLFSALDSAHHDSTLCSLIFYPKSLHLKKKYIFHTFILKCWSFLIMKAFDSPTVQQFLGTQMMNSKLWRREKCNSNESLINSFISAFFQRHGECWHPWIFLHHPNPEAVQVNAPFTWPQDSHTHFQGLK